MDFGNTPVSRAEFERNLAAKRVEPGFLSDIRPLLAIEAAAWDGIAGLDRVLSDLVARLPGLPWAGEGEPQMGAHA